MNIANVHRVEFITLMMRMLRTWTMTPFVLYRFALGGALLIWLYA